MKRFMYLTLLIPIILVVLLSCGEENPTYPGESGGNIFSENAIVLDELSGITVQGISDDQVIITFSSSAPDISSGDCIVSSEVVGSHFGCIRNVVNVDIQESTMTIETSEARLTDAVIQCSVDTTFSIVMSSMVLNEQPSIPEPEQIGVRETSRIHSTSRFVAMNGVRSFGKGLDLSNVTLYSGNVGGADLTVSISSGSIEFEPDMDIGWEIENSQVTEFHAIATGDLTFNCDIEVTVGGSLNFSADTTIASFSHVFVQFIGWFPVVEVVTLSFVAGFEVEADAAASVETGFDHTNTISVGAEYEGSWSSVWEYNPQLTGHQTDWTTDGEFEIRGFVRPVISVDLYGIMGPYLEIEPYLGFRGGIESTLDLKFRAIVLDIQQTAERIGLGSKDYTYWWELAGGVTGTLGFDISILGYSLANFNTELFEWEIVLDGDSTTIDDPTPSVLSLEFTGETDSDGERSSRIRSNQVESLSTFSIPSIVSRSVFSDGDRATCQVTASWTECPDSDFLSYTLFRSTTSGIENDTSSAENLGTFTNSIILQYADNDVTWETDYYYALITRDTEGLYSWSNENSITTPSSGSGGEPTPSVLSLEFTGETDSDGERSSRIRSNQVENLSALPIPSIMSRSVFSEGDRATCQVTASWTECPDSDFLSYTLFRSTTSGIENDTSSAENLGTFTNSSTLQYADNDVTWETDYYYALITRDTEDLHSWSNESSITTPSSGGGGGSYPDSVIATTYVGDGPSDLCSDPLGNYIYVVNEIDDSVAKVRTSDNALVGTIAVGYLPGGICIIPSGAYLYVTSMSYDNVSVIRTSDFTITNTIGVGNNPRSICSHPNGQYVYAVNNFDDNVAVIQTSTNTVVATIPVGNSPWDICTLSSGEYLYVTNANDASVSVIRTSDNTVITTISVIDPPKCISALPSDDYIYVTSSRAGVNNTSVIRTSDNTVVGNYEIGDFPYAISSLPIGEYVYITHPGNDNVSIVQSFDNTVVATVGVGDNPMGICALPSGDIVYVTNHDSDNISVLSAEGGGGGDPTPSVLSVEFTGDSITCQVTETWTECPDSDFQSYTLYRAENPGISQDTSSTHNLGVFTSVSTTEYVDDDVTWETNYYYALLIRDDENLHAWSNEVEITTPSSGGGSQGSSIVAWGDNGYGQCDVPSPNENFVAIDASYHHSLGLKEDSTIVAWGYNAQGQCDVPEPNENFIAISAGNAHSLGLKEDGSIMSWGWYLHGQCDVPEPNEDFVALAGGGFHSLGLKGDGSIEAWGFNNEGQCDVPTPNSGFVVVAAGGEHSLGLKTDSSIVAWGNNDEGQCNVPLPNTSFVAIAIGWDYSLGLKEDGSIVAWGNNNQGQCNVPSTSFVSITCGGSHSLGLKSDGSIVAWGSNNYSQCNVPSPNEGFVDVAGGSRHSLGLIVLSQ